MDLSRETINFHNKMIQYLITLTLMHQQIQFHIVPITPFLQVQTCGPQIPHYGCILWLTERKQRNVKCLREDTMLECMSLETMQDNVILASYKQLCQTRNEVPFFSKVYLHPITNSIQYSSIIQVFTFCLMTVEFSIVRIIISTMHTSILPIQSYLHITWCHSLSAFSIANRQTCIPNLGYIFIREKKWYV